MPGSRRSRRRGASGARAAGVPATRKPPRDRVHRAEVVGDLDAHAAEELALDVRPLAERAGRATPATPPTAPPTTPPPPTPAGTRDGRAREGARLRTGAKRGGGPADDPHRLRLPGSGLEERHGVVHASREHQRLTQRGGDAREPERQVPGPAELEAGFEDRDRRPELTAPDVDAADSRVRGRERVRVVHRVRDPDRLLPAPDP